MTEDAPSLVPASAPTAEARHGGPSEAPCGGSGEGLWRDARTRRTANDLRFDGADIRLDGCSVLIAEDNIILSMHLSQMLEIAGAEVMGPFPFANDALGAIAECRPDLAVLDYELSGGDVLELAETLARQNVPFAYFTSYREGEMSHRAHPAPLIPKPSSDRVLLSMLAALRSG